MAVMTLAQTTLLVTRWREAATPYMLFACCFQPSSAPEPLPNSSFACLRKPEILRASSPMSNRSATWSASRSLKMTCCIWSMSRDECQGVWSWPNFAIRASNSGPVSATIFSG